MYEAVLKMLGKQIVPRTINSCEGHVSFSYVLINANPTWSIISRESQNCTVGFLEMCLEECENIVENA
jgi:hypothetical protein